MQHFWCHTTVPELVQLWQQLSSPEWKTTALLVNKLRICNQSTTDIFCNQESLINIHEAKDTLHLQADGGVLKCNTRGLLDGCCCCCIWCDTRAIANVISLDHAEKRANLTHHAELSKALWWATKKLKRSCFLKKTRMDCVFHLCLKCQMMHVC